MEFESPWADHSLTLKQLEMYGCILNTVATDTLVLNTQVFKG